MAVGRPIKQFRPVFFKAVPSGPMESFGESSSGSVAGHYDRLDQFCRQLWGEPLHDGLWTDPAVLGILLDASVPDQVFARTAVRIWGAQHLGVLRYGWLVAEHA